MSEDRMTAKEIESILSKEIITYGDFALWDYSESELENGVAILGLLSMMKKSGYKLLEVEKRFGMQDFFDDFDLHNTLFFEKNQIAEPSSGINVPPEYR